MKLKKQDKKKEQKQQKKQDQPKADPLMEMKCLLQRKQAELENYRKQTEKRVGDLQLMASRDVISQILPVMDNFELALKNVSGEKNDFVKGVELIYSQLLDILQTQGVKVIKTEKQQFDPYKHEALMKIESDQPENQILEVFQKGFTLHDKVIRHARVKVSAGKKSD